MKPRSSIRRAVRRLIVVSRYWLKSTPEVFRSARDHALEVLGVVVAARARGLVGDRRQVRDAAAASASRAAISSGGRTRSTAPLAMALCGMPGCCADCSSWANVTPPAALISQMPSVPSEPVPDRITPTA